MKHKTLNRKVYKLTAITEWATPHGYDLKIVTLAVDAFKMALNLAIGPFSEFKKFIGKEYEDDISVSNTPNGMCVAIDAKGTVFHFVWLPSVEWTSEWYGTLVHELHHFTRNAYSEKGMEYHRSSEEAFAYLQGHMMELACRALHELDKSTGTKTTPVPRATMKKGKHRRESCTDAQIATISSPTTDRTSVQKSSE